MNFYSRHLGDYAKLTGHLTMLEHGAYTLLLDRYYASEKGIPEDQVYKITKATSKAEKKAVDGVLDEFFILVDGVWTNKKCEEDINRCAEKSIESEEKKNNEKERVRRHRQERSQMFEALRNAGFVPDYNIGVNELRTLYNKHCTQPVTRTETVQIHNRDINDTANHNPISISTNISTSEIAVLGNADPPAEMTAVKRHAHIAILLRERGVKPMTEAHPLAHEWAADERITDELLTSAVSHARQYKPYPESIPPDYLKPIIAQYLNPKTKPEPQDQWWTSNDGIDRKGREVGIKPRPTESYPDFKNRIFEHILGMKGGQAA